MRGRDSLPPIIYQVIGLAMAVFFAGFWAITNRVEPTILGLAVTLFSVGLAQQARSQLPARHAGNDTPADSNEAT